MNEFVAILDFGGQYKQLIARRVRECNVYCEILPYTTSLEALKARNPKGIILTGGPNSVYDPESPTYDKKLLELGIPELGIGYGSQLLAGELGGGVIYALRLHVFNEKHIHFGTHEIFHLFVMAGTFCHFMLLYRYLVFVG